MNRLTLSGLCLIQALCMISFPGASAQSAPIPRRYDGFPMGNADAPLLLEAFYDFMCPDSKASWPALKQTLMTFGPSKIRFYLHVFPLPYHHNSFIANQGGLVAETLGGSVQYTYNWMEAVYAHQDEFGNDETANMTMNDVIEKFGQLASSSLGVSQSDFVDGLNNRTLNLDTRTSWKYACSRSVTGTPSFLLNGVQAPAESTWTVQQWKQFLSQYL
eukprot:gb/GECG01014309.1/.p1 GENE.gb/GECG01014309.1/~~gb/GECG01014309.1/.p1  ORF type:complete len:217 (+),score=18.75 gb/GECG01014309.1/:1-651(+)